MTIQHATFAPDGKSAAAPAKPFRLAMLLPGLAVNVAAPIAIFKGLEALGMAPVWALAAGCAPPLLANLIGWLRTRRIDAAGFLIVASMASGVVGSLLTGSLASRIVTDCIVGCGWSLGFGGSLLLSRPALFYLIRSLVAGDDATRAEAWNELWRLPVFRAAMRTMTGVWAAVYVAQVLIEVAMARMVSADTVVAVAPLIGVACTFGLIAFTRLYMRSTRRSLERAGLAWPL